MTDVAKALENRKLPTSPPITRVSHSAKPNPVTLAPATPEIVQLVELGDPRRDIPPCASCHRAGSGGPIEAPILAEQGHEYLVKQLQLYASGERHNDVYARMRTIAARLTPAEIEGLSAYYRAGFR